MPIWCGDGTPGIHLPGSNIVIAEECHHSYESAAKTKTNNAATCNINHRVIPNRIECNIKWKDQCKMMFGSWVLELLHCQVKEDRARRKFALSFFATCAMTMTPLLFPSSDNTEDFIAALQYSIIS